MPPFWSFHDSGSLTRIGFVRQNRSKYSFLRCSCPHKAETNLWKDTALEIVQTILSRSFWSVPEDSLFFCKLVCARLVVVKLTDTGKRRAAFRWVFFDLQRNLGDGQVLFIRKHIILLKMSTTNVLVESVARCLLGLAGRFSPSKASLKREEDLFTRNHIWDWALCGKIGDACLSPILKEIHRHTFDEYHSLCRLGDNLNTIYYTASPYWGLLFLWRLWRKIILETLKENNLGDVSIDSVVVGGPTITSMCPRRTLYSMEGSLKFFFQQVIPAKLGQRVRNGSHLHSYRVSPSELPLLMEHSSSLLPSM